MTIHARLVASFFASVLSLAYIHAADAPPPVVVESAPDSDPAKLQQEVAALRAENQRIASQLRDAQWALGEARSRLDELAAAKSTATPDAAQLAAERARAEEANTRLATLVAGIDKLNAEKADLESRLAATSKTESDLRQQLAVAQQAANAVPTVPPETVAKLADDEKKLADYDRRISLLQAENELLNKSSADQAQLFGELQTLRQEKAALEGRLAAQSAAENKDPADNPTDVAVRLAETESKLATVLRSYSQLEAETERLRSATTLQAQQASELEALRREKSSLEAKIAANPTDQSHHLASRLAESEDKLSTALRSYSLLQAENDRLKSESAHAAESAQASAAKSAGDAASQTSALYDELRQTQARAVALTAENSQLKTRLALVGSPPGSTLSAPSRPGSAQAAAITAPAPAAAPVTATETPTTPGPRTHVVAVGDTLGKISRQYYGTPSRWEEILRANKDVVKNENALTVGMTLRIP